MKITDINVAIGGRKPSNGQHVSAETVLKNMEDFRIDRSVAYYVYGCSDPQSGNAAMLRIAKEHADKLSPCVVVDPALRGDSLPGTGTLGQRLARCQAEAVRIFPDLLQLPFHRLYWQCVLEEIDAAGLPLIVDCEYNNVFFSDLPGILDRYHNLKLVMLRCGLWHARKVVPLQEQYSNIYFDMSTMLDSWQIEQMQELNQCSRLLFGSGFPDYAPTGALGLALYAQIPEASKDAILYKNWEDITK